MQILPFIPNNFNFIVITNTEKLISHATWIKERISHTAEIYLNSRFKAYYEQVIK